jgi:DNA invertase Pin-like site-specific DNA recombinase
VRLDDGRISQLERR